MEPRRNAPVIYEFRITLRGIEPPIYRIFRVSDRITFKKLHKIIQVVMGWQDYHLYEFKYGPIQIGIPDGEYFIVDAYHWDASKTKLSSLKLERNDVLLYNYDFGDDWSHLLEVQISYYSEGGTFVPVCLEGENACPPEDVGGIGGFQHFLEVLADPDDEKYEHYRNWSGGNYDPQAFDIDEVNKKLAKLR
jgi:hypothetical protein